MAHMRPAAGLQINWRFGAADAHQQVAQRRIQFQTRDGLGEGAAQRTGDECAESENQDRRDRARSELHQQVDGAILEVLEAFELLVHGSA